MVSKVHTLELADSLYFRGQDCYSKGKTKDARIYVMKAKIKYYDVMENGCTAEEFDKIENYISLCDEFILKTKPPKKHLETLADRPYEKGGKNNNKRVLLDDEDNDLTNFDISTPKLTFDDVAGMQHLKEEFEETVIYPLVDPEKYGKYVAESISGNGILLYGPPGCGKTYITKCAAGELSRVLGKDVTFIKIQPSDVKDKWLGNSEKNLRKVFETAYQNQPAIIFFDELEELAKSRGSTNHSTGIVQEFLQDFEIIEDSQILVVGATNCPWDVDFAIQRSGRIGNQIYVGPPDFEARRALFEKYFEKIDCLDTDINLDALADFTEFYSSSDIVKNICPKAGRKAFREARTNPDKKVDYVSLLEQIRDTPSSLSSFINKIRNKIKYGKQDFSQWDGLIDLLEEYDEWYEEQHNNGDE